MTAEIVKDLFLDAFWQVIYFPAWWYSLGLKKTVKFCLRQIKSGWQALALTILLNSFFKPMYGQKGFEAYFLSFMVRLIQIFWRILFMAIWSVFWLFVFILWFILPALAVWRLIIG